MDFICVLTLRMLECSVAVSRILVESFVALYIYCMKSSQITMSVLITMEVVSSSAIILFLGIVVDVKMVMHWQAMDTHAMVTLQSTTFSCVSFVDSSNFRYR